MTGDQVPASLTRAINSELGMAAARGAMLLMVPAFGLFAYLVHDWITSPVVALSARVTTLEQTVPLAFDAIHQDEMKIGVMGNSMDLGRQDRLAATEDTKAALSALNAKTDQLQSSVAALTSTMAGMAATLDVLKGRTP